MERAPKAGTHAAAGLTPAPELAARPQARQGQQGCIAPDASPPGGATAASRPARAAGPAALQAGPAARLQGGKDFRGCRQPRARHQTPAPGHKQRPGTAGRLAGGRALAAAQLNPRWEQMRALQAIASSQPPPKAAPSIAATVGLAPPSTKAAHCASTSCRWPSMRSMSGVPNRFTSKPALNRPVTVVRM